MRSAESCEGLYLQMEAGITKVIETEREREKERERERTREREKL